MLGRGEASPWKLLHGFWGTWVQEGIELWVGGLYYWRYVRAVRGKPLEAALALRAPCPVRTGTAGSTCARWPPRPPSLRTSRGLRRRRERCTAGYGMTQQYDKVMAGYRYGSWQGTGMQSMEGCYRPRQYWSARKLYRKHAAL